MILLSLNSHYLGLFARIKEEHCLIVQIIAELETSNPLLLVRDGTNLVEIVNVVLTKLIFQIVQNL